MSINVNNLGKISDKESQKITNKFKDIKEIQRGYDFFVRKKIKKRIPFERIKDIKVGDQITLQKDVEYQRKLKLKQYWKQKIY